jgi:rsbT co-antagonist protein RsbR
MAEEQIQVLIVDITGVLTVYTMVSDHLIRMATAVRLMGGECILTGISPEIARTVTQLGVDLSILHTRSTLHEGLTLGIKFVEAEGG